MISMRFRADTAWAILKDSLVCGMVERKLANVLCGEGLVVHEEEVNIGDCVR